MKKDAYYFSHDANAQDDPKCILLIDKLGSSGYGIFWLLVEKLSAARDYKLPIHTLAAFAKRWKTTIAKIEVVIRNYDLFTITQDNYFYSERLINSMKEKSEKASKAAKSRWEKEQEKMQTHAHAYERMQTHANGMQTNAIKGKERKGNKGKKVNTLVESDFEKFWDLYDKKVGEKEKLKIKWDHLTAAEHEAIFEFIPKYKQAQPEKKFRKDPQTFLNHKSWLDEIIQDAGAKILSNGSNSKKNGQAIAVDRLIRKGETQYATAIRKENFGD